MNTLVDVIVAVVSWLLARNSGTLEPGISLLGHDVLGPVDWRMPDEPPTGDELCPFFVADTTTGRCAYCDRPRGVHTERALQELA